MKFGLVPYFYQITDAQTKEPRQEHVGNDFMAHCIDEMMANHQGKGCLEGTHKKELDVIVDFLSIINAQKGVQASLRRFEIDPADHSIFMCIDIAAKGLNRKIKDMMFWGE